MCMYLVFTSNSDRYFWSNLEELVTMTAQKITFDAFYDKLGLVQYIVLPTTIVYAMYIQCNN